MNDIILEYKTFLVAWSVFIGVWTFIFSTWLVCVARHATPQQQNAQAAAAAAAAAQQQQQGGGGGGVGGDATLPAKPTINRQGEAPHAPSKPAEHGMIQWLMLRSIVQPTLLDAIVQIIYKIQVNLTFC